MWRKAMATKKEETVYKKTVFDAIKEMSINELANFLESKGIEVDGEVCRKCPFMYKGECPIEGSSCMIERTALAWLLSEYGD